MRRIATLLGIALLGLAAFTLGAGGTKMQTYTLFNGVNSDTTEQASYWVPISGANRICIRTWSAGAATDTNFCDSITTWKTLFSDSVSFIAKDSLGVISTSRSSFLGFSDQYTRFPVCFDSTVATGQAVDSTKAAAVMLPPLTRPIRGSGVQTMVYPVIPTSAATFTLIPDPSGVLQVSYMRIRVTPRTRLTTAGYSSTAGLRTRGIRGLRMTATVYSQ